MTKKSRKCIGVILARPEREYQTNVLEGIYQVAFENDMNVAVFSIPSMQDENEYRIFDLINFDLIEGLIYLPDTFTEDALEEDVNQIVYGFRDKGGHIVTVDEKLEGIPSFFSEDTNGIIALTEHFIQQHHCKRVAFMTGIEGHPHAEKRLEVFKETMKKNGLFVPKAWTYYGDFWINQGDNFVQQLLDSEEGLPEAILCANEYMADSVYKALQKRKLYAPDAVLLGCFATELNRFQYISSVIKNPRNAGAAACKAIIDWAEGQTIEDKEYSIPCDVNENFRLTCGCVPFLEYDFSKIDETAIQFEFGYFSEINDINEVLHKCDHMEDIFWSLSDYYTYFKKTNGMYFCMYDGWDDPGRTNDTIAKSDMVQLYCYQKTLPDGEIDQHVGSNIAFPKQMMLPELFLKNGTPSAYFFRELHFYDKDYGYLVIDIGDDKKQYDFLWNYFVRDIVSAIESQCKMQSVNHMYKTDVMTGLNNRNGFSKHVDELIAQAERQNVHVCIALGDMNGLKYINDNFGHNEGDVAIKEAARIFSSTRIKGTIREENFRIGGDEFVKVAIGDFDDETFENYQADLWAATTNFNYNSGKEYPIYISVGICCKKSGEDFTVDTLLCEADSEMYKNKMRIKKETGFATTR